MRHCSKCGLNKSLEEFYIRKTGHRTGSYYEKCRDCYKQRGRNYYQENRERQLKLALLRKQKYKEDRRKFLEALKNAPCMDCKKKYPPWVMDFDHRDGETKIRSVSRMAITDTSNLEVIKQEIAKCDLVCANCHRQRTHDRLMLKKSAEIANEVKAPL